MTITCRFDALDTLIAENRLIRGAWKGRTEDGRETACLLAALSPEAGESEDATACPASVMWPWLALLTPWLDDSGSNAAWPEHVRRYAAVVRRLDPTDDAASRRCDYACRGIAVRAVAQYMPDIAAAATCEVVAALCDRVASGDEPSAEEWTAAWAVASVSWEAASAASRLTAAWASWAVEAAMEAASVASRLTAAWAWTTAQASAMEVAIAADRIIDAILTVLEGAGGPRNASEA